MTVCVPETSTNLKMFFAEEFFENRKFFVGKRFKKIWKKTWGK